MDLQELGWDRFFQDHFTEYERAGLNPARVISEHKHIYRVCAWQGQFDAALAGRIDYNARSKCDYPTVGDWVAVKIVPNESKMLIKAVLPRKSRFIRKSVGKNSIDQQLVAVNIETAFLVTSLDAEFNLRRLERYLVMTWDSGAKPVIVLNKSDICRDIQCYISQIRSIAPAVPVHPISATENEGIEPLFKYLGSGKTVSLLGSSGVGKSTIINRILGFERQPVAPVREQDRKGKHTTTYRELIVLPKGGAIIDNPGMRQLHLWGAGDGITQTFDDIEEIALECRFRDCRHFHEPDCAVIKALKEGKIREQRVNNFRKLKEEIKLLDIRQEQNIKAKERAKSAKQEKRKLKKHKKSN